MVFAPAHPAGQLPADDGGVTLGGGIEDGQHLAEGVTLVEFLLAALDLGVDVALGLGHRDPLVTAPLPVIDQDEALGLAEEGFRSSLVYLGLGNPASEVVRPAGERHEELHELVIGALTEFERQSGNVEARTLR